MKKLLTITMIVTICLLFINVVSYATDLTGTQEEGELEEVTMSDVETEDDKPEEEIAMEVISGIWGNNDNRKKTLERHGYNYSNIQRLVNDKIMEAIRYLLNSWKHDAR